MILHTSRQFDLLAAPDPEAGCCWGAIMERNCTCWMAVLDQAREPEVQQGPSEMQPTMCHDCAYRVGSPEREAIGGGPLPSDANRQFVCHENMPRAIAYVHPDGTRREQPYTGDYRPRKVADRAWQADGQPAKVCAGWSAAVGVKTKRRP